MHPSIENVHLCCIQTYRCQYDVQAMIKLSYIGEKQYVRGVSEFIELIKK